MAEADIPVVLSPVLCTPIDFDSIHCLTDIPLSNGTAVHILHKHCVKITIVIPDNSYSRNWIWDAGWLSASSTYEQRKIEAISQEESIKYITNNLRDIYGLENALNQDEFIVYSGSPFDMTSKLIFIHSNQGLTAIHEKRSNNDAPTQK